MYKCIWIVYDVILALEFLVGVVAGGFCVNSVVAVAILSHCARAWTCVCACVFK